MPFAYSDLLPCMMKWARFFSNEKYELYELINVVWLKGRLQRVDNIKKASFIAKCDMLDYIRLQEGSRKHIRKFFYTNTLGGSEEFDLLKVREEIDEEERLSDIRDELAFLIKEAHLDFQEQYMLKLFYWEDQTLEQIAGIMGFSTAWVGELLNKSICKLVKVGNERTILYG